MTRKTQMILWIATTIVGMVGVILTARAVVTDTETTNGIIFLSLAAVLLLITYSGGKAPGKDKGDTVTSSEMKHPKRR
jgi:hypothetical protein